MLSNHILFKRMSTLCSSRIWHHILLIHHRSKTALWRRLGQLCLHVWYKNIVPSRSFFSWLMFWIIPHPWPLTGNENKSYKLNCKRVSFRWIGPFQRPFLISELMLLALGLEDCGFFLNGPVVLSVIESSPKTLTSWFAVFTTSLLLL